MRKNLPVTSVERFMDKHRPVVSTTDLKGRITYANSAFIDISGFSKDELIGQPHNLVRHPDMPPEAFADLWNTVKRGQPWRGLVKNRCKDGAFYWVEAFVTPLHQNGQLVGFMSVRNVPDRAEVDAVSRLYAEAMAGKARIPATPRPRWWHSPTPWAAAIGLLLLAGTVGQYFLPHAGWMAFDVVLLLIGMLVWNGKISAPLAELRKLLSAISEGNLTSKVDGKYTYSMGSVLQSVMSTRIHMRATFCDVLQVAASVDGSAGHVNDEIAAMRKVVDEQRDRLSRVAAAVEELSVSIREASSHTATALSVSETALGEVDTAEAKINESVEGTTAVADAVNRTNRQINELHGLVSTITGVTQAISDIANQTNLLALNAAIEAARAGESGRGFAVVAEEVRTLSDRTAGSTADIGKALQAITQFATATSASMQDAVSSVHQSGEQIRASAGFFEHVRDSSRQVVDSSRDISSILQQQSSASDDVANSMEGISAEVERTSDAVSALQQATESLKKDVDELRHLLVRYEHSLY